MFRYCAFTGQSGSNMADQHNFNCFNCYHNKNKVHFPIKFPEGICRGGGKAPHIHTTSTRRMRIVSLTPSNGTVGKGYTLVVELEAGWVIGLVWEILGRVKYNVRNRTPNFQSVV
jgi:hypothetical protein